MGTFGARGRLQDTGGRATSQPSVSPWGKGLGLLRVLSWLTYQGCLGLSLWE